MVSLVDIYNINESVFNEIKSDRDPSRGNKGKNREKDFELVSGEPDPETGRVTSKVVRKPSISNMVKDLEAEVQDFEKLIEDKSEDVVLYNISEELKEIYNKFRTHVRKNYPEEYKKVQEASTLGTGTSITPGKGAAYATPYAFGDNKRKKRKGYMGYKEI
tara:strand:+ start:16 stop:498 length:483 start_codon:yes stop_codon:yes gene_type:complete